MLKVSREGRHIADSVNEPVVPSFTVGSIGPLAGYFLQASPQAASIKDTDGRYVYVNLEFEKTFGASTETARGLTDKELFDFNTASVLSRKDSQILINGQSSKLIETITLANMGSHEYTVYKFRFGDSSGRHYVGAILFDVTDSRRAFRLVTESQHRLKAAIEAGFDSFIAMEPIRDSAGKVADFRIVDVNRNAEKLVSKSRWELVGNRLCEVLPVNRERGFFERYVRVLETQTPLEEDFALFNSADRFLCLRHQVVPLGDGVAITTRDITEQKRAEMIAAEHTGVLENALGGIAMVGEHNSIIFANAEFCRMFSRTQEEFGLQSWHEIFAPEDWNRLEHSLQEMTVSGRADVEVSSYRPDGTKFYLRCVLIPSIRENQFIGHYVFAMDITEQREYEKRLEEQNRVLLDTQAELQAANAQLEKLASTDGLTGLRNRRDFEKRLMEEVRESVRYGKPLSVVMLDVDKFKEYNDSFGHPAGDEVLRRVAHVLVREARDVDLVARYGGEEFAILLPDTRKEGAVVLCERFRTAIERNEFPNRAITASFGCAEIGPGRETPFDLVEAADRALYDAKANGRNRVCWAE